jgi:hypothetical protein
MALPPDGRYAVLAGDGDAPARDIAVLGGGTFRLERAIPVARLRVAFVAGDH